MDRTTKNLFRAIVVAGAALTGVACSGDDTPPTDSGTDMRDAVATADAPGATDAPAPEQDAGEDATVLIL